MLHFCFLLSTFGKPGPLTNQFCCYILLLNHYCVNFVHRMDESTKDSKRRKTYGRAGAQNSGAGAKSERTGEYLWQHFTLSAFLKSTGLMYSRLTYVRVHFVVERHVHIMLSVAMHACRDG